LAIGTDFSGDPTFRALLHRVDNVVTTAYAHRHVPFEMLQRTMKDEAKLNSSLLLKVMFVFDGVRPQGLMLPHLSILTPEIEGHLADSDLAFFLSEDVQGIGGYVEYRADKYDEYFIASMLENYQALLSEVALNPGCVLADIPLGREGSQSSSDRIIDAEVEFQF